jgi:hypothetical protein
MISMVKMIPHYFGEYLGVVNLGPPLQQTTLIISMIGATITKMGDGGPPN